MAAISTPDTANTTTNPIMSKFSPFDQINNRALSGGRPPMPYHSVGSQSSATRCSRQPSASSTAMLSFAASSGARPPYDHYPRSRRGGGSYALAGSRVLDCRLHFVKTVAVCRPLTGDPLLEFLWKALCNQWDSLPINSTNASQLRLESINSPVGVMWITTAEATRRRCSVRGCVMDDEIVYLRRRASEERTAALQARNTLSRLAHVAMAEEYENRVRRLFAQMGTSPLIDAGLAQRHSKRPPFALPSRL